MLQLWQSLFKNPTVITLGEVIVATYVIVVGFHAFLGSNLTPLVYNASPLPLGYYDTLNDVEFRNE